MAGENGKSNCFERFRGRAGFKALIGSGMFWVWFDALFMGAFFPKESMGSLPEIAAIIAFGSSVVVYAAALFKNEEAVRFVGSRKSCFIAGLSGFLGSVAFVFAGIAESGFLLALGGILSGVFMGVSALSWGGVYCKGGSVTAIRYLSGGFAIAMAIDVPLLCMDPWAASVFFSLSPLATMALFALVDERERTYAVKASSSGSASGLRAMARQYLGVQLSICGALCLIMLGFGYFQHLMSFSLVEINGGAIIQIVRGVVAVFVYLFLMLCSQWSGVLYRAGLLAIIAGFMVMSFLFGTETFWLSGAIIMAGYTVFDVLKWAVFSQLASTQSKSPIMTISFMRMCDAVFYVIGASIGLVLGATPDGTAYSSQESMVVGYCIVIAIVLLLGSEDIWCLFRRERAGSDVFSMQCSDWGLTQREGEILRYLAAGRTQPWIADNLHISENTVSSHVRHIYQKADVHSRQELLDRLVGGVSHDSREGAAKPH